MSELPKGLFKVGNKLYGVCQACGSIVRIDKPIFGDLHLCVGQKQETEKDKEGD